MVEMQEKVVIERKNGKRNGEWVAKGSTFMYYLEGGVADANRYRDFKKCECGKNN